MAKIIEAPKIDLHKLLWEGGWEGKDRVLILTAVCGYESDFQLDWWQDYYIRKKPNLPMMAANKSRRVGWSFITAGDGLLNAMDPQNKRYTKQFVSYSLEDAKEKIKTAREFYESIPEVLRPKKLVRASQTYLEFLDKDGKSTSRLVSWPCKGPRGKGGDVSLDEMAFYGIKAEEVYTAAMGVVARGGSIEIGSTPFGASGRFYEILTDRTKYRRYKAIEIPWWYSAALCTDVVQAAKMDKLYDDEKMVLTFGTEKLQEIFESMPLPDFLQEYALDFRDEAASYITLDMIQSCVPTGDDEIEYYKTIDDLIINYDPKIHGTLYAGYDVGRTNDASELVVMGYHPEQKMKTVIGLVQSRGAEFDKQENELVRFMNELPVHRLCIDETGLGMMLAENVKRRKGARVEGVTFTNELKEDMAQSVYLGYQRREYLLPPDKDLVKQTHSIKKTVTAAGNSRFDAPRNEGHHADRFWAFALADHAVSGVKSQSSSFYEQYKARKGEGKISSFSQAQVLNRMRAKSVGG